MSQAWGWHTLVTSGGLAKPDANPNTLVTSGGLVHELCAAKLPPVNAVSRVRCTGSGQRSPGEAGWLECVSGELETS